MRLTLIAVIVIMVLALTGCPDNLPPVSTEAPSLGDDKEWADRFAGAPSAADPVQRGIHAELRLIRQLLEREVQIDGLPEVDQPAVEPIVLTDSEPPIMVEAEGAEWSQHQTHDSPRGGIAMKDGMGQLDDLAEILDKLYKRMDYHASYGSRAWSANISVYLTTRADLSEAKGLLLSATEQLRTTTD